MPSWVWGHMKKKGVTEDGKLQVECNYCDIPIRPQRKASVSNAAHHLRRHHKDKLLPPELGDQKTPLPSGRRTVGTVNKAGSTSFSIAPDSQDQGLQQNWTRLSGEQFWEVSQPFDIPTPVMQLTEASVQVGMPTEDEDIRASQPSGDVSSTLPPMTDFTHGHNCLSMVDDSEMEGPKGWVGETGGSKSLAEDLKYTDPHAYKMVEQAGVPSTALEYGVYHVTSQSVAPVGATLPPKMQAHIAQHSQQGETNRKEQHSLPHDATSTDKLNKDLEYICEHYLLNSQTEMFDAARRDDTNTASPSDSEANDDGHDEQVSDESNICDTPTTIEDVCKEDESEDTKQPKDDGEIGRAFRYDTFPVLSTKPRHLRVPSGDAVQCRLPALQLGNGQQVLPVDPALSHFLPLHTHELRAEHSALSGYVLTQQQRNSAAKGKNAAKDSQHRKKRKHAADDGAGGKLMRKEKDKIPSSGSCNSAMLFSSTSATGPAYVDSLSAHNRSISQKVEDTQLELRDGQAVMRVLHQLGLSQFYSLSSVSGVVPTTTVVPPDIHTTVQPAACQLSSTAASSSISPNLQLDNLHISPAASQPSFESFPCDEELHEFTSEDFPALLDSIVEDIRACDFISCDGEFTGISKEEFKAMPFDTVSERYDKLRQGNMGYLMCQVGLCMFSQKKDGGYTVKPYNFYVMPQQFGHTEVGRATEFTCQASSVNFLASHGFNFNKVFHEGISYLRPADESRLRDSLVEKQEARQTGATKGTPIVAKGADKKYIDSIIKKIDSYAASPGGTDAEPLELEPGSAFRRKLIYQHVEAKYPDQLYVQSVGQGRLKHISVSRVNVEERRAKEKTAFENKMAELDALVGFSKVVREISNSKKLLVGHNMLLDVMYIISQFMSELPQSYDEFKVVTSELFPSLLDTKVMSSTYLFKEEIPFNSLDELIKNLSSSPFEQVSLEIDEGFPDYEASDSDTKFHDAAFDAYVTGKSFALMAQHIGSKAAPPVHNLASNSKLLTPFVNKLNLNRIQDIPYMNIGGPEVLPDREHVYYLTFPSTFTRNDINQVFFPSSVYVSWIDKTSAMVSLQERSENAQVKSMLRSRTHDCVITSYAEWHSKKSLPSIAATPSGDKSTRLEKRKLNVENSESSVKSVKLSVLEPTDGLTSIPATAKESARLFDEHSW